MPKLNWREIYAAVLLLLISIILLVMQARENFSYYSDIVRSDETSPGSFTVSKGELIDTLHTYFLMLLGFLGSILLLRKRNTGWIISIAMLVFYLSLAVYGLIAAIVTSLISAFLVAVPLLILLTAVIFLVIPSTLKKFRVSKRSLLPTLLLFMALVGITFFLK